MFLSEVEIMELSGYKIPKCQMKWLREHGIKFVASADGKPKVMIKHLEIIMGCAPKTERLKTKPDFDALDKLMGIA